MNNDFTGKVAIVTGGGTGLGKAISMELARRGATVVIASRKLMNLRPTAKEITKAGGKCDVFKVDVRKPAQVQKLVDFTVEKHGRIDILVNNAAGNFVVKAEELTSNGFTTVVDIVLNGTWHCTSAVGKQMIKQGGGNILSIVATYSQTGAAGVVHSASAKAGVEIMMKSLAKEWGRYGIRLNSFAPGIFVSEAASKNLGYDTPEAQAMIARTVPAGRLTTVEEMAGYAAFIVSPGSAYMTGATLTADGGQCLSQGVLALVARPKKAPDAANQPAGQPKAAETQPPVDKKSS